MASLQATLLAALIEESDLVQICARMNRLLWERTPVEHYATFFLARAHADEGGVRFEYSARTEMEGAMTDFARIRRSRGGDRRRGEPRRQPDQ